MKPLPFVVVLALLAACAPSVTDAPSSTEQPIVNGTAEPEAIALTAGQQLSIGYLHPRGRARNGNFCTGTLITGQHVATASHCTQGSSAGEIGFSVGQSPGSPDATFDVAQIWNHPSVDAAILVLTEDVTATLPALTPIPRNVEDIPNSIVGEPVQAGGFGDTRGTNPNARWFATVYMLAVRNSEIVVDGRGEQGICYGDSGSGVIAELSDGPVVLGVESWGDDSCVGQDHLTRLDRIDDWISAILDGEVPEDPCEGLDFEGRCDGDVAEWCSRGEFRSRDCAELGATCDYISDQIGYACACPDDLTFQGRCDQNIVEYCDDEDPFVRVINCAAQGLFCSWENDETGYVCAERASCSPEDEAGRCEDDVLVGCDGGQTQRVDCTMAGGSCVETDSGASCEGGTGGDDAGTGGGDTGTGGDDTDDDDAAESDTMSDAAGSGDGSGSGRDDGAGGTSSGCSVTSTSTGTGPVLFLALVALVMRRRRAR